MNRVKSNKSETKSLKHIEEDENLLVLDQINKFITTFDFDITNKLLDELAVKKIISQTKLPFLNSKKSISLISNPEEQDTQLLQNYEWKNIKIKRTTKIG